MGKYILGWALQKSQVRYSRRLQVRAESQQTATNVKSSGEWRVTSGEKTKSGGKSPSEFYALGGVLGIKCVGVFNEQVGSFAQGL